jgi:hypothetical protein
MPLAAGALETATGVKGGAFEEGPTQDIAAITEGGSKLVSLLDGSYACHP